jgi:hypothetical protein
MNAEPKGPDAARLRKIKFDRLRGLKLPPDGLPGSLTLNLTKCGKPTCRCVRGELHQSWILTFTRGGRRRVERIPREWVEDVQRRVEDGRDFREAVSEILEANAELLVLLRQQRRR